MDRRRRLALLFGLSAGLAALEALLVVTVGPDPAVALVPQIAAPAPFGSFHDLRWLLVYHPSWLAFVAEAGLVLVLRAALDTVLVRLAWPADVALLPWRAHFIRTLRYTAIVMAVLLPFAVLVFSMAVTSLSWLFFVAVPVLVMIGVLVHHGAVSPTWWRDAPTRVSVGVVVTAFAILTVAGGVLSASPGWLAVLVAAVAGGAMGWCRLRLVRSLAGHTPAPRRRPFAVVGLAGVLALVVGGTAIGFAVSVAVEGARTPLPPVRADATGPPVLIVKGFNSKWDGVTRRWVDGDYRIQRFSYAGLDADGAPEAYDRPATHDSLRVLAWKMREQVDALADETGEQVRIVAESEGALVTLTYLAATPGAPVRAAVLLSPLLAPGRVYYPPLGDSGWGVVSGTVMAGIAAALGAVGPVDVSPDTPLFRSILDQAPPLQSLLRCPVPGVRELAILPLDSGVSAPAPVEVQIAHAWVPAFHGGLLGDGTTAELVGRVLRGDPASGSGTWSTVSDVVNAGASAWQAPSLQQTLERTWASLPEPDDCAAARRELQQWVG